MMEVNNPAMWARREDVAMAVFSDGVLAFQATDCRLLSLNELGAKVLATLNRPVSLSTVTDSLMITTEFGAYYDAQCEVFACLEELEKLRLIKRCIHVQCRWKDRISMNEKTRYLANSDVSCRIEDEDGAILYNPNERNCQVINAVGLELWQCLSIPKQRDELASHLCTLYDGVTQEDAERDVDEFLQCLVTNGFVGEIDLGCENEL